jgi:hypothetical protein
VKAGKETEGIVLVLERTPFDSYISGVVLLPDGTPSPRFRGKVTVTCEDDSSKSYHTFLADENGRFQYVAKRDAEHTVVARDDWCEHGPSKTVIVHPGTTNIVLKLKKLKTFRVAVRSRTEELIFKYDIMIIHKMGNSTVSQNKYRFYLLQLGGDLLAKIPVPTGEFEVHVVAPGYQETTVGPFMPGSIPDPITVLLDKISDDG